MKTILGFICLYLISISCSNTTILDGKHRIAFTIDSVTVLPVQIEFKSDSIFIINGDERISITSILIRDSDTLAFKMPYFDSYICMSKVNAQVWNVRFIDSARKAGYHIDGKLEIGNSYRFDRSELDKDSLKFEYSYKVAFDTSGDSLSFGIAKLQQFGNRLEGTILTPTGDYRYLSGVQKSDSFYLSAFDGAHAFVFKGIRTDSIFNGNFYSGNHYTAVFTGNVDNSFKLANSASLTTGVGKVFEFEFPDLKGNIVKSEVEFKGKPLVIQIMGSWCPNCMDETRFLVNYRKKSKSQLPDFVALAFERHSDDNQLKRNLERYITEFGIDYTVLIASNTLDKKLASDKLKVLNAVISYPTTVFLNYKHEIVHIHTGFNGPATGKLYEEFENEFARNLTSILKE